jgi:hypothetical protein
MYMRKIFFTICFICIFSISYSQTPSTSIRFKLEEIMYHGDSCASKYSILIERCKFHEEEIKYDHDTSKIDWKNLPEEIKSYMKCKIVYEDVKEGYVIDGLFRNHDYSFEFLFKIKIYREKCGKKDTMVVSFPVKISSFATMIVFDNLYFSPGMYDLTDDMVYFLNNEGYLIIKPGDNALLNKYFKF